VKISRIVFLPNKFFLSIYRLLVLFLRCTETDRYCNSMIGLYFSFIGIHKANMHQWNLKLMSLLVGLVWTENATLHSLVTLCHKMRWIIFDVNSKSSFLDASQEVFSSHWEFLTYLIIRSTPSCGWYELLSIKIRFTWGKTSLLDCSGAWIID